MAKRKWRAEAGNMALNDLSIVASMLLAIGSEAVAVAETHNFKSTDSTIDKDPKLTLQVSSPRGFEAHLKVSRHRWLKIKNPEAPRVTRGRIITSTDQRQFRDAMGIAAKICCAAFVVHRPNC